MVISKEYGKVRGSSQGRTSGDGGLSQGGALFLRERDRAEDPAWP